LELKDKDKKIYKVILFNQEITAKEIRDQIKIDYPPIYCSLKRLIENNLIFCTPDRPKKYKINIEELENE